MRVMGLQAIYQAPRTTTNALPLMETRIVNNSGPVSGSHHVCGARFFREAMSSSLTGGSFQKYGSSVWSRWNEIRRRFHVGSVFRGLWTRVRGVEGR